MKILHVTQNDGDIFQFVEPEKIQMLKYQTVVDIHSRELIKNS